MIRNRVAIIALLTGLNFLNYIDRYVLSAVLKHMSGELQLTHLQAGLAASAFLIGYFATAPWFGARADRGRRKGLIAAGVLVWSIATAATGLVHGVVALLVARAFVGVGEASYAALAPTIIDDLTPPERKSRTLAIFYLAIPLGSALGFGIGGIADTHWGWRQAFFVVGGPGVVLALLCLAIAEPARKLAAPTAKIAEHLRTLAKIPLYRRAVLGYCAYTAAVGAFAYGAPSFLQDRYGVTSQSAGIWFGAVTVLGGAVGTILGGWWADRDQRAFELDAHTPHDAPNNKRAMNVLLRVCAIGMIVATPFAAAAFFMPTPAAFYAAAFVAEIGLFLSTSPVNVIGLRSVPPELRASAMAAMIFAIHLFGDLWSPPALGLANDALHAAMRAPATDPFPTTIAMMMLPVVFAISAFLWWPRRREAEPAG
jgi:MFS family permease